MIILLDGVLGIGKTSVINEIEKRYVGKIKLEVLEADYYFRQYLHEKVEEAKQKNTFPVIGGVLPQNNVAFLEIYKNIILEKSYDSIVISDMALAMSECKSKIHDFYVTQTKSMIHIILEANKKVIQKRINEDENPQRDKKLALDMLDEFDDFLCKNYKNAIRISTENRAVADIAEEVLKIIYSYT